MQSLCGPSTDMNPNDDILLHWQTVYTIHIHFAISLARLSIIRTKMRQRNAMKLEKKDP